MVERAPARQDVSAVAVSADGAAVVYTKTATADGRSQIVNVDRVTGRSRTTQLGSWVNAIAMTPSRITVLSPTLGAWFAFDPLLTRLVGHGKLGFGAHDYGSALSPSGRWATYTNSAPKVPVWATTSSGPRQNGFSDPQMFGRGPGVNPQGMALADDGTLALVDAGVVYVSTPTAQGAHSYRAVLQGFSAAGVTALAFRGGSTALVAASANHVVFWNLAQYSRIAVQRPASVAASCVACVGPAVEFSPDGNKVAYVDSGYRQPVVHDFMSSWQVSGTPSWTGGYGPVLWDGSSRVLFAYGDGRIDDVAVPGAKPVKHWAAASAHSTAYLGLTAQHHVAAVDDLGVLTVRNGRTGAVERTWKPPPTLLHRATFDNPGWVAVDPGARYVAYVIMRPDTSYVVDVVDTATDRMHAIPVPADGTPNVTYVGRRLVVATAGAADSGATILDRAGAHREQSVHLGGALTEPVFAPSLRTMAYERADGRVVIADVASGAEIGGFSVPASVEALKTGLAFSDDGASLAAVTEGTGSIGRIQRWIVDPTQLMASLCATSECGTPSVESRSARPATD